MVIQKLYVVKFVLINIVGLHLKRIKYEKVLIEKQRKRFPI